MPEFPLPARRYHSLHISPRDALRYTPSTWPTSASKDPEYADPYSYGLRLRGSYIVDLDKDRIIPFVIEHVSDLATASIDGTPIESIIGGSIADRIAYTTIASAASPGGLFVKMQSGHAKGMYIVLPSVTRNIDIVRGILAPSAYSIAVPIFSPGTVVRTNILLMTPEQALLMDRSEIKHANYRIIGYDGETTLDPVSCLLTTDGSYHEQIPSVAYDGGLTGLRIGKDTMLAMNMQATSRRSNIIESTLDHYYSEIYYLAGLPCDPIEGIDATSGNELLMALRARYIDPARRERAVRIVTILNERLTRRGHFSTYLQLEMPDLHDPYLRADGAPVFINGIAKQCAYDPHIVYANYRLALQERSP